MSTRRKAANDAALGPEDLSALAAAVAEGKRATVYLQEATPSLNLPAGASAKVVRVEGNTVVVRPRGVDDELPFEAVELRLTRLPPKAPTPAPKPQPARKTPAPVIKPTTAVSSSPATAPAEPTPTPAPAEPVKRTATRSAPRSGKKLQDGISVTIHGGPDNDWTVSVAYGARPAGKATPVKPDSVERAVAELGDATARDAVDAMLSAARDAVSSRIAELSRQLEEARSALAELGTTE